MRGYFGIGIYQPKHVENVGTLWRSAHSFGASFIFTVGHRYRRQASDTTKSLYHIPLFEYDALIDFEQHKPYGCETVCIELTDHAESLDTFSHPLRAAYILGAEDHGLPEAYTRDKKTIVIPGGTWCLNVATAGSIVLYDRLGKARMKQQVAA